MDPIGGIFLLLLVYWIKGAAVDGIALAKGQKAPSQVAADRRAAEKVASRERSAGKRRPLRNWAGNVWANACEEWGKKSDQKHEGRMKWLDDNADKIAQAELDKQREKEEARERSRNNAADKFGIKRGGFGSTGGGGRHAVKGPNGPGKSGVRTETLVNPGARGPKAGGAGSGDASDTPTGPVDSSEVKKRLWTDIGERFLAGARAGEPINALVSWDEWTSLPPKLRGDLVAQAEAEGKTPFFEMTDGTLRPVGDVDREAQRAKDAAKNATSTSTPPSGANGSGTSTPPASPPSNGDSSKPRQDKKEDPWRKPKPTMSCVFLEAGATKICGLPASEETMFCPPHETFINAPCQWVEPGAEVPQCTNPRISHRRYCGPHCDEADRRAHVEREEREKSERAQRERDEKPSVPCQFREGGADAACGRDSAPGQLLCPGHMLYMGQRCFWKQEPKCTNGRQWDSPYCGPHTQEADRRAQENRERYERESARQRREREQRAEAQTPRCAFWDGSVCGAPRDPDERYCPEHKWFANDEVTCRWLELTSKEGVHKACPRTREADKPYCVEHLTKFEQLSGTDREVVDGKVKEKKPAEEHKPAAEEAKPGQPQSENKKEESMSTAYIEFANMLTALAERTDQYSANMTRLSQELDKDKWGKVDISGPVNDMAPPLADAGAYLREAAQKVKEQGDQVRAGYDQHPYGPEKDAVLRG